MFPRFQVLGLEAFQENMTTPFTRGLIHHDQPANFITSNHVEDFRKRRKSFLPKNLYLNRVIFIIQSRWELEHLRLFNKLSKSDNIIYSQASNFDIGLTQSTYPSTFHNILQRRECPVGPKISCFLTHNM